MSEIKYLCPECRGELRDVHEGELDTWQCPDGHGIGLTLTESYGHFQEDEIRAIWAAAGSAPTSSLKSPTLGRPMVSVTVVVDDDEIEGNEGPGARPVTLDVAPDEQFLWLEVVDFKNMPADLPNPKPSEGELAKLRILREKSKQAIADDLRSRDSEMEKVGYRFGSRASALLGLRGIMKRLGFSGAR